MPVPSSTSCTFCAATRVEADGDGVRVAHSTPSTTLWPPPTPSTNDNALSAQVLEALGRHEVFLERLNQQLSEHMAKAEEYYGDLCRRLDDGAGHISSMAGASADELFEDTLVYEELTDRIVEKKQLRDREKLPVSLAIQKDRKARQAKQSTQPKTPASNCGDRLRSFLDSQASDVCIGIVVVLDMFIMFVDAQLTGYGCGELLGLHRDTDTLRDTRDMIQKLEIGFNLFYLLELVLRVLLFPCKQFRDPQNCCDAAVVIITCTDAFLMENRIIQQARLFKFLRILRVLQIVRSLKRMGALRILMRSLFTALDDLMFGILMIVLVVSVAAVMLANFTFSFIEDESNDLEAREWMYEYFGTATHAWWTLFEAAFTGTWVRFARRTIDEVSYWYALFWLVYILGVNFALTRVIAAMFLKATMSVANADSEAVAAEKMARKEMYTNKLREIFELADTDGTGAIDKDEFESMLKNHEVLEDFQLLDLNQDELAHLFHVLSDTDGQADYEEFLDGALRMKTFAKTIDTIMLHQEMTKVYEIVRQVSSDVKELAADRPLQKCAKLRT